MEPSEFKSFGSSLVGSSIPRERVCPLLIVKRLFATKEKRVVPARQGPSPAFWDRRSRFKTMCGFCGAPCGIRRTGPLISKTESRVGTDEEACCVSGSSSCPITISKISMAK